MAGKRLIKCRYNFQTLFVIIDIFWFYNLLQFPQVRGAPAIAIVGCLSLAVEIYNETYTDKKSLRQEIEGKLNYLVSARPTAVNMKLAADELIALANVLSKDEAVTAGEMKIK